MERKRMRKENGSSRRSLVFWGFVLVAMGFAWQLYGDKLVRPGFVEVPGLPGWQQVQSGGLTAMGGSATSAVLIGIDDTFVEPLPPNELCKALYQDDPSSSVAVFTDFFCPNCAELEVRLAARALETPNLELVWHQLPLLGEHSEMVAKAAEAAALQDGYDAFMVRLQFAAFRPTTDFLMKVAVDAGLDGELLVRDMEGSEVAERLLKSRRAAETLGLFGTPAFTKGRTLAIGAVPDIVVDAVLEPSPQYLCMPG